MTTRTSIKDKLEPSRPASVDAGDLYLIDDMLARSPEERLSCLEETLRSLEALLAATGSTIPAE